MTDIVDPMVTIPPPATTPWVPVGPSAPGPAGPTGPPGSGGGGDMVKLFSQTLGVDTATLDTGAGGIAGGYSVLEIHILAATDDSSSVAVATLGTFNGDTAAHYEYSQLIAGNSSVVNGGGGAQTSFPVWVHGATGSTTYPGTSVITIPGYADTTFWKAGLYNTSVPDATFSNIRTGQWSWGWRSTAAITRFTVTATATKKFKAGSRLLVYGLT